ncbi:hypothetical protein C8R44DRAFT_728485 [Mycena epipterygia]|nr:hypothetical protein C8R44DRAFT_728485 [Mycena epipterygia]
MSSKSPFIPSPLNACHSSSLEHLAITPARPIYGKSVLEMDMRRHLKGLRKLSLIDIFDQDKRWVPFLLEPVLHPTLQHLELSFQTVPELALPPFPALRYLKIAYSIYKRRPFTLDSALGNIHTNAPLLKCLSLTLKLCTSPSWGHPCPAFASLDFVQQFPALRRVQCWLYPNGYWQEDEFEQYMGRIFPGRKETGILPCSII